MKYIITDIHKSHAELKRKALNPIRNGAFGSSHSTRQKT